MSGVFYSNTSPNSVLYIAIFFSVNKGPRCRIMCLEFCLRQRTWRPALHSAPNWSKTLMIQRQVLLRRNEHNCIVTDWKAVECTVSLLPNAFPCPICWRDIQGYLGRQRVRSVCIVIVCTRHLFFKCFYRKLLFIRSICKPSESVSYEIDISSVGLSFSTTSFPVSSLKSIWH